MATNLATPGVYIEEKSSFGTSVVPVQSAVPAFVGYTEKAKRGNNSLVNVPTKISNFAEYISLFGGPPKTLFDLVTDSSNSDDESEEGGQENSGDFSVELDVSTRFLMYYALKFYFLNGGSDCYIVSVGNYSASIEASDLNDLTTGGGIAALEKFTEPTILVVPEAIQLSESDCYSIQSAMLLHCGFKMQNRFAILDVYNGSTERSFDDDDVINNFREGVGANFLQWGAAYYPFVNTTLVGASDVDFTRIKNQENLIDYLKLEVDDNLNNEIITPARADAIKGEIDKITATDSSEAIKSLHATLNVLCPSYNLILAEMTDALNVFPPSSAMAGIYCMVDNNINIAKAPANLTMGSVVSPTIDITNENQEELNLPINGKAVNAIRSFPGKGSLVWGARTLDGNSKDYRYISVRRTMIFLEQSIKAAAEAYVFSPNDGTTWSSLRATVYNFLNNQWSAGILAGSTPQDAFSIDIGLGTTMTSNDILDGILKMSIKVAIVRPAEFIVITFEQQQQKS